MPYFLSRARLKIEEYYNNNNNDKFIQRLLACLKKGLGVWPTVSLLTFPLLGFFLLVIKFSPCPLIVLSVLLQL